jgi:hypothetical protein
MIISLNYINTRIRLSQIVKYIFLLLSLVIVNNSYAITRSEVIANASSYANYSWYCSSSNADPNYNSYTVGWQTGVAYNWGGVDTIGVFQQYIDQGVVAGDSKVCTQSHCLDFAGVDCSGFVTRCWGMSNGCSDKLNTSALVSISTSTDGTWWLTTVQAKRALFPIGCISKLS